jgi:hypothetical protein
MNREREKEAVKEIEDPEERRITAYVIWAFSELFVSKPCTNASQCGRVFSCGVPLVKALSNQRRLRDRQARDNSSP